MSDEKWIHKQDNKDLSNKKKWIMSKCFVVFTHIKTKGKRNILKGKHIFITTTNNPWKELMDEICIIYDFEKIETINLLSDAGSWILAGSSELKLYAKNNIVINTCEFHVKQKINRSTTDKDLRDKLYKIIYEDEDKNLFLSLVNNKERYQKMIEVFNEPNNNFEFYFAKIIPEIYINNYQEGIDENNTFVNSQVPQAGINVYESSYVYVD